ncbi:UDP-galactose transporter senju-like isoform X2 [Varroa destructor]|uniref:Uncharacterized protein n=1 Tax=Varroa destructor TaxID=109461 RepID=A0A7M7JR25_VARDE|nr:UDP-galactose transporter senju-like isoform X2 [Varroa destructor]
MRTLGVNRICDVQNGKFLVWATKFRKLIAVLQKSRVPTLVLVAYVALFAVQYVLVRGSQTKSGSYLYNVMIVVGYTETVKLAIACAFLFKEYHLRELCVLSRKYWFVPLLYVLPSGLYCISNNLVFYNLQAFDPTTYNTLLQFRIVLTGIVFQLIFKRVLSPIQWFSLLLLTVGCLVKQLGTAGPQQSVISSLLQLISWDGVLLLGQILCSCLASVLNELFLKGDTGPFMLNNFCMYFTSVIANAVAIIGRSLLYGNVDKTQFTEILSEPLVLAIIINGAASGMMIPLFLRYFNSITRVFTVSIELTLMAFSCWAVFGTPLNLETVATIIIVLIATYLYVKNPVRDKTHNDTSKNKGDEVTDKKTSCNPSGITIPTIHLGQKCDDKPQIIVTKIRVETNQ